MKEIITTNGFKILVDDENYDRLSSFVWYAVKDKNNFYARCQIWYNKRRYTFLMHRIILYADYGTTIDHIDHNGLNNQTSNLRFCTNSQNQYNKRPRGNSKYLGVYYKKTKWKSKIYVAIVAQIKANNRVIHLGYFKKEEDAAVAYNKAALKYHGNFANLNKF